VQTLEGRTASIFLSYVREDAEKARALASFVERAGHSVWWDRQIKGGAQYATEIETALNASDKIVVLWSKRSIASAWVRDEAAVGRDTGRLIPVSLDRTPAPLGFRQFQTIDLAGANGRPNSPQLQDLLNAIGDDVPSVPDTKPLPPVRPPLVGSRRLRATASIGVALLLAITGAGWWWWTTRNEVHTPVFAIDAPSGSPTSREVARQLTVRLGDLQSARSDLFQLVPGSASADLILQVDAQNGPTALTRDLTVVAGRDKSILWSTSLQQPPAKAGDLAQQLTLTSERVVSCATEALSDRRDRVDAQVLKQYLNGCSRLESDYGLGDYDPKLIGLFDQVVTSAPHLAGAWAKLLQAETEVARGPDAPPDLVRKLRSHIVRAQSLGMNIGEIYAARAALLPTSDFSGNFALLDQAIREDPNNAYVYRLRGEKLQQVGRMSDSISDANAALLLDPLSPALLDNYVSALAYGGKTEVAYAQLAKAEAMWPEAQNLKFARYRLDLRFGNPQEALATLRSSGNATVQSQESFLKARIHPSAANIQRLIDDERMTNAQEPRYIAGLMQALGQFGRKDEAIDVLLNYKRPGAIGYNAEVLFRPALHEVWRDPRSIAGAAHVGLLAYWKRSGKWPDFCFDPTLPYDCKKEAAKYRV
jgi:tetratricopeptide (TPR) repeat protein